MAARRRKHAAHDEEHENHERWLITYADMITLLMVLFIVLYAIGQTDLAKFEELKKGLSKSLGDGIGVQKVIGKADGDGVLDGTTAPVPVEAVEALQREHDAQAAAQAEHERFENAQGTIQAELAAAGLDGSVDFRLEERGLVVTIVVDNVLFDVGSASLRPEGQAIMDHLAGALSRLPNPVAVEGHTDDSPIRGGGTYASNWELSTARATSVLRYLAEQHGIPADRLSASGYADQRPLAPNDTPEGKARNRRVEIVVLSETARQGVS